MTEQLALLDAISERESLTCALASALAQQGNADAAEVTPDGFFKGRDFRIFPIGKIASTKGTFKLSADGAKKIAASWANRGNDLQVDYEHGLVKTPPGQPIRTAGWFRVEARADGLYATDVRWTKEAFARLSAGEVRHFSPLFDHDDQGNVTGLENIALTVDPATHRAPTLVAASAVPYASHPVVDGPWDADAAEHRLRKWASKDGSGDTDTIDFKKYAQGFAYVDDGGDKLADYKLPHHDVKDGKLVTSKRGVEAAAGAVEGARGGVKIPEDAIASVKNHLAEHYHEWGGKAPWESAKTSESKTTTSALSAVAKESTVKTKKLAKYLKSRMDEHELEPKELAKHIGIDHDRLSKMAAGETEPDGDEMKKLSKGLGVKHEHLTKLSEQDEAAEEQPAGKSSPDVKGSEPSKSEGDAAYKVSEKTQTKLADKDPDTGSGYKEGALKKLTALANDAKDPEIRGLMLGLVDFQAAAGKQIEALSTQIATLTKEKSESEVERVVEEALSSGKLTPAMRDWAMELGRGSLKSLQSYLSVAIPHGPGVKAVRETGARRTSEGGASQVSLSAVEEVAKSMGKDPKELLKRHEARLKSEAERGGGLQ